MITYEEYYANERRFERNNLLRQNVDSINYMRWESMTDEQKNAWKVYRQALLDVPDQEGFPYTIDWPTKPE